MATEDAAEAVEDLEVAVAEIGEEEEVAEALTEEATVGTEVRAALAAVTADLVTGPVPSLSAETQTSPGETSATSARILKKSAWEAKEEAEAVTEETEEEGAEDMGAAATETTEGAEAEALGETEEGEEEVVMEGVMTEEEAAEEEASAAAETEMIGEEAASEAEEGEETGVAGASEVTDAVGEVDLAEVGTGVEGAPWEEAGEVVIGTGLTKH